MTHYEELRQLPLWTKEVLDAIEVSSEGNPDPVCGSHLQCQPTQQKGQPAYIQPPLPGCEPEEADQVMRNA